MVWTTLVYSLNFFHFLFAAKVERQTETLFSLANKSRQFEDRNKQLQAALDEHKQKASAASSQLVSSEAQHKQEVVLVSSVFVHALFCSYSNRPLTFYDLVNRRKLSSTACTSSKRA